MKLGFKMVHPDAKLPSYAHDGDAGMDVYAVEDVDLLPLTPTLVKTGLIADIPIGYELQVRPRSGLALKQGITVWNGTGTIDSGYRSEIGVILLWAPKCLVCCMEGHRFAELQDGEPAVKHINRGERVAQMVLSPVTTADVFEVDNVSNTERGINGFGSTGK